jgi:phosphatidylglycerophosphate synthase
MKRAIPWAMILLRAVMGPLLVLAAWKHVPGGILAAVVVLMLLDDITDGILARRWGCDTPTLRLSDSAADTVFYLGTAVAIWFRAPHVLLANRWLIVTLFALEGLSFCFDIAKYRKAASYHSYLAKFWGLVLATAIVCALSTGGPVWLVGIAAALGILVNLEGLAMSLLLPRWQNDVKTLVAALRLRRAQLVSMGKGLSDGSN